MWLKSTLWSKNLLTCRAKSINLVRLLNQSTSMKIVFPKSGHVQGSSGTMSITPTIIKQEFKQPGALAKYSDSDIQEIIGRAIS